jgi:integrase
MARKIKDAALGDRTNRLKLKVRSDPYFKSVTSGLHLGYRRMHGGNGAWIARRRVEVDGTGRYVEGKLGVADDYEGAINPLSFDAAVKAAMDWHPEGHTQATGPLLTVRQACEAHIAGMSDRRSGWKMESSIRKNVLPALGDKIIRELTREQIEKWLRSMVRTDETDTDMARRSKDTANKNLSLLKAALNRAFASKRNKIPSDTEWRLVKPFKDVGRARTVHFDPQEIARLRNACDPEFRKVVTAYALTGARPFELRAATVSDFNAKAQTIAIRDGKTGPRVTFLTQEGVAFFQSQALGKKRDELLLPTYADKQHDRLVKKAAQIAKLPADTCMYSLRHSYASEALLRGVNMQLLAENMGTSLRMIEQNYGHIIAENRRAMIEQSGIRLGLDLPAGNVAKIA